MACELVTSATTCSSYKVQRFWERRSENLINQMSCVDLKIHEGWPRLVIAQIQSTHSSHHDCEAHYICYHPAGMVAGWLGKEERCCCCQSLKTLQLTNTAALAWLCFRFGFQACDTSLCSGKAEFTSCTLDPPVAASQCVAGYDCCHIQQQYSPRANTFLPRAVTPPQLLP